MKIDKWVSHDDALQFPQDYEEVDLSGQDGVKLAENDIDKWVYAGREIPKRRLPEEYFEALKEINKNILGTSSIHQNSSCGVPVFSDGKCLLLGLQAWDGLMEVLDKEENERS